MLQPTRKNPAGLQYLWLQYSSECVRLCLNLSLPGWQFPSSNIPISPNFSSLSPSSLSAKVKLALSFMKRGSRTQSQPTTQAWVNSVAISFIFSSSPLSLCVPPTEWWKVNSKMMDRRPGEHRWGDRCRDRAVEPGWAQPLLKIEEKKLKQTAKIFLCLFLCHPLSISLTGAMSPAHKNTP